MKGDKVISPKQIDAEDEVLEGASRELEKLLASTVFTDVLDEAHAMLCPNYQDGDELGEVMDLHLDTLTIMLLGRVRAKYIGEIGPPMDLIGTTK